MAFELITAPATEPLALSDAKTYLNVSGTAEDSFISGLIQAMRESCEVYTRRALITQTWRLWLDAFPAERNAGSLNDGVHHLPIDSDTTGLQVLELARSPIQSVTHIKTHAPDDTASVFSSNSYFVDSVSEPARVVLNANSRWPTDLRPANAVEVEFVAGYGAASDVPRPLVDGMLLWMKILYSDKTWLLEAADPVPGLVDLNRIELPPQVKLLWDPYRIHSL